MAPENPNNYRASVRVTDRVLNTVNPLIFGENIEWIENGMGLYLPDEKGFDPNIVQALRETGITHLRYPGGILSDYFDWHKAVGADRQPQLNPFSDYFEWYDRINTELGEHPFPTPQKALPQYSYFGPDEFIALCRELNIPGTITLNAGTGKPEDAARWFQYCCRRCLARGRSLRLRSASPTCVNCHTAGMVTPMHTATSPFPDDSRN